MINYIKYLIKTFKDNYISYAEYKRTVAIRKMWYKVARDKLKRLKESGDWNSEHEKEKSAQLYLYGWHSYKNY